MIFIWFYFIWFFLFFFVLFYFGLFCIRWYSNHSTMWIFSQISWKLNLQILSSCQIHTTTIKVLEQTLKCFIASCDSQFESMIIYLDSLMLTTLDIFWKKDYQLPLKEENIKVYWQNIIWTLAYELTTYSELQVFNKSIKCNEPPFGCCEKLNELIIFVYFRMLLR